MCGSANGGHTRNYSRNGVSSSRCQELCLADTTCVAISWYRGVERCALWVDTDAPIGARHPTNPAGWGDFRGNGLWKSGVSTISRTNNDPVWDCYKKEIVTVSKPTTPTNNGNGNNTNNNGNTNNSNNSPGNNGGNTTNNRPTNPTNNNGNTATNSNTFTLLGNGFCRMENKESPSDCYALIDVDQTETQCKALCEKRSNCQAFEYTERYSRCEIWYCNPLTLLEDATAKCYKKQTRKQEPNCINKSGSELTSCLNSAVEFYKNTC